MIDIVILVTGDVILKLDGFETLQKFIEISPDQDTNTEVLKLITNLSYGERKRRKWLETDMIPVLLGKLFIIFIL